MYRLEAVCRLLLRVEAVHVISWLWVSETLVVGDAIKGSSRKTARNTTASGAQLTTMLPILRRRRRGVLLGPLFRCDICLKLVEFNDKFVYFVSSVVRATAAVVPNLGKCTSDAGSAKSAVSCCRRCCDVFSSPFAQKYDAVPQIPVVANLPSQALVLVRRHVCRGFALLHKRTAGEGYSNIACPLYAQYHRPTPRWFLLYVSAVLLHTHAPCQVFELSLIRSDRRGVPSGNFVAA